MITAAGHGLVGTRLSARTLAAGVLTTLCAAGATAQSPATGAQIAESYRLSMPTIRKVLPALYHPGRQQCEKPEEKKRDPLTMTLSELTARLDRCAPVRDAIVKSGTSTEEAAQVLAAMLGAGRRMADEESAKITGQEARALPAGALKDNVALLRKHEPELKQLTQPQDPRAGS